MNPEINRLLKNIKNLVSVEENNLVIFSIKNSGDWLFNYQPSDNTFQIYGDAQILTEEEFIRYLNQHILN